MACKADTFGFCFRKIGRKLGVVAGGFEAGVSVRRLLDCIAAGGPEACAVAGFRLALVGNMSGDVDEANDTRVDTGLDGRLMSVAGTLLSFSHCIKSGSCRELDRRVPAEAGTRSLDP